MNSAELARVCHGSSFPWRHVLIFLGATLVHSLWLISAQIWWDVSLGYIAFPQLGPALGLLTLWVIYREELRCFLPIKSSRMMAFRYRGRLVVLICVIYVGSTWLLAEVLNVAHFYPIFQDWHLIGFLTVQYFGAFFEEIGWRGFLQPIFVERFGPLAGTLIVGTLWAAWHGDQLLDLSDFLVFASTCIAISYGIEMLMGGSWWQRALLAAAIHWTVNITPVVVINFDSDLPSNVPLMTAILAPQYIVGCIGALILWKRRLPQLDR
ncbi:CAAX amino terminal protease self- immunity [Arcanobacterium haemolyticum]|uniref:Abortive infection protein n=2 Tax=Arcanobacterium haemolyticum TaxID=28264 RepID=D7BKJ0_ARCHD|nr:Abortive infection protein [Arcanobacterium haemolyticum DSM 20595]SQH28072.1 CAAX amino terminal protease self- immunity [Arcanobacterium haemolyticum]